MLPSPRLIASTLLIVSTLPAGAIERDREEYIQQAANAALGLMAFTLVPDVTTSTLTIQHDGGDKTDLTLSQLGAGATMSDSFPIYLEGNISYARYDPGLVVEKQGIYKVIPLKWNSFSASGGIGYDFDLTENWVIRPIVNVALGRVISDIGFTEWWLENELGKELFDAGRLDAYGYGGSLMLDYELFSARHDIDAEFRYSYIRLESFGSTSSGLKGEANAQNASVYLRRRAPTGIRVFDRPLRWVLEGAHTQYFGEQRGALGFSYISSLGAGLELDTSKYDLWITRTRLVGRYMFSENTQGYSVGVAISF